MNKSAAALLIIGAGIIALLTQGQKIVAKARSIKMGKAFDFVSKMINAAKAVSAEFNLPVWLILTQSAHESAFGLSGLTQKAFNLFGFTGEAWKKEGKPVVEMPTTEYKNGVAYKTTRPFRAYSSLEDSLRDYARLLTTQPRYKPAVDLARKGDIAGAFEAMGRSGYATDPTYGSKLAGVYEVIKEHLV